MIEAYFTEFTNQSNWVKGIVGDYTFEAKLFNVGSRFGIDKGRVSKLTIYSGRSFRDYEIITDYDRRWKVLPNDHVEEMIFNVVMELLENSPMRDLD